MRGKDKCNLLKAVRCKIARENGIDYRPTECTFQGECKGTCPKCEAELQKLTNEIEKLKNTGKRVAVAGIAAAMVAGCASGCVPRPTDPNFGENQVLDGDVAAPKLDDDSYVVRGELPDPTENEEKVDSAEPKEEESNNSEKIIEELAGELVPPEDIEMIGDVAFPEETPDA